MSTAAAADRLPTLQLGSVQRYAIIGGGSFVGVELAHRIVERRHDARVYLLDLRLRLPCNRSIEPIGGEKRRIEFIEADVTDAESLARALGRARPDAIVHAASFGMSGVEQVRLLVFFF